MEALQLETSSIKKTYTTKFELSISKAQTLHNSLRTKLSSLTVQSPTKICNLKRGISSEKRNSELGTHRLALSIKAARQSIKKKVLSFHYLIKLFQNDVRKKNAYDQRFERKRYEKEFS